MGREESKEQSKSAQREKEAAAHGKKQERKDKVWEKGAKDSSKADASAASASEATERKAAAAAQVVALAPLRCPLTAPACAVCVASFGSPLTSWLALVGGGGGGRMGKQQKGKEEVK